MLCCWLYQGRHEEYEQQHRAKLQQEEEAARKAAEFKVGCCLCVGQDFQHEVVLQTHAKLPLVFTAEAELLAGCYHFSGPIDPNA